MNIIGAVQKLVIGRDELHQFGAHVRADPWKSAATPAAASSAECRDRMSAGSARRRHRKPPSAERCRLQRQADTSHEPLPLQISCCYFSSIPPALSPSDASIANRRT
jgi:hypothetical protein